ncbi:hypothetical protein OH77DRAFT_1057558 [Trametes cingulata]|nr:hypothetical protein OH77DRAFT_1057558 [Trametes cingulata]
MAAFADALVNVSCARFARDFLSPQALRGAMEPPRRPYGAAQVATGGADQIASLLSALSTGRRPRRIATLQASTITRCARMTATFSPEFEDVVALHLTYGLWACRHSYRKFTSDRPTPTEFVGLPQALADATIHFASRRAASRV